MLHMNAEVFLSCGQKKGTPEHALALKIAKEIRNLGFGVYVAVEQPSLKSLREEIFERLSNSEYFLFIDFRREQLLSQTGTKTEFRGSLFCHQELAVASYLQLKPLLFHESGVKEYDGMLGALQANSIEFSTETHSSSL